ncbi:MAG: cupin domain-containing protein [bacterium]
MIDQHYWIERLDLKRHLEGGYFKPTYTSKDIIPVHGVPERFTGERPVSTAIYYLLPGDSFSAFHRLKADELWHFYAGTSLTIHIIDRTGGYSQRKLGHCLDHGETFQAVIEAGCWFGAAVDDSRSYSLVGCTVAPGFDFNDFEIGDRQMLIELFPAYEQVIIRLTR